MSVGHGSAWWSSELVVHTAALRMLWFLLPWLRAGRLGSMGGGVCRHLGRGYRVNVTEVQKRHEEGNKPCRSRGHLAWLGNLQGASNPRPAAVLLQHVLGSSN